MDPNTLYATIVQSSATIAAIVAGFMLSTILAQSARRDELDAGLHSLETECRSLFSSWKEARFNEHKLRANDVIGKSIDQYLDFDLPIPAATVREQLKAREIDDDAFETIWLGFANSIQIARDMVAEWSETYPIDLPKFKFYAHLNFLEYELWREKYLEAAYRRRQRETLSPEKIAEIENWKPSHQGALLAMGLGDAWRAAELQNASAELRDAKAYRRAEIDEAQKLTESRKYELERSAVRLAALREERRNFRFSSHLLPGALVLGFLVVTGVFYPLWLMPQEPASYRESTKQVTIGLFAVGVVLVAGYCVFLVWDRKKARGFDGDGSPIHGRTLGQAGADPIDESVSER